MSFHYFRRSFWPGTSILNRIWSYHDRNPFPPAINLRIRKMLYLVRAVVLKVRSKQRSFIYGGDHSLNIAPKLYILKRTSSAELSRERVFERFETVHKINEVLHSRNGSWVPQPLVEYYGKGISIEEVALRVRGYVSAYLATDDSRYLKLAEEGCNYLIRERIYHDGHIHLQAHLAIDLPYAFAGEALLSVWKLTKTKSELIENAKKIGDRLLEYQIAGSVNHAVVPVQFLGLLYQCTGEKRYLKNCVKRLFRSAVPYQLPYGGWAGHESWVWYHALILRSLIIGYVSLPSTLEYYAKKDRLALCINSAVNRLLSSQLEDGSFPIRPPEPLCEHKDDSRFTNEKAEFDGDHFKIIHDSSICYGSWNGYVLDALITGYELLDIKEIIPSLTQFANNIVTSNYIWRLEFDTLGAGRLLEFTEKLSVEKKEHLFPKPTSCLPAEADYS